MKNIHRRHQIALRRRPKWPARQGVSTPQSMSRAFIMAVAREAVMGINPKYLNAGARRRRPVDAPDSAQWEAEAREWKKKYDTA